MDDAIDILLNVVIGYETETAAALVSTARQFVERLVCEVALQGVRRQLVRSPALSFGYPLRLAEQIVW